jgi:uncharacterized repeat protein (TIGR03803 family)
VKTLKASLGSYPRCLRLTVATAALASLCVFPACGSLASIKSTVQARPGNFVVGPKTAAASEFTIYSFQGGLDGGIPEAGLIFDNSGAVYGVSSGGQNGSGIVFMATPPVAGSGQTQWTKTTLYAFQGGADGAFPQATLTFDSNGALYGATREGGSGNSGTVFKLSPPAAGSPQTAWTKTTLYNFQNGSDGANPLSGVALDNAGALYGTTVRGGATNNGVVYKLTPAQGGYRETLLYSFQGDLDGANPYSSVTFDAAAGGALYGTTAFGGHRGAGTVYKLSAPANGQGPWIKTLIRSFDGVEGNFPRANVVFGSDHALYGATYGGGAYNAGMLYKLTPPASPVGQWGETVLYNFTGGPDGANPYSAIAFDSYGTLYGTAYNGGASSAGVLFTLTPPGANQAQWTENVLYAFTGGADGAHPGGLAFDMAGAVYGVTASGAIDNNGTIFQVVLPAGSANLSSESNLHSFGSAGDGADPYGALVLDNQGNAFGTTTAGGAYGFGAVFKLTPPSGRNTQWTETLLYSFTGGGDGAAPQYGALDIDSNGNLYGATKQGGDYGKGVVFRLTPPRGGQGGVWTQSVLHSFSGGANDGDTPYGGVIVDNQGNLYGQSYKGGAYGAGVVYELSPPAQSQTAWTRSMLYHFTGGSDGSHPASDLTMDNHGALYGTTYQGGSSGLGVAFKLTPPGPSSGCAPTQPNLWCQTLLHAFAGGSDGDSPSAGALVQDVHGALYGATVHGGASGNGVIYKLAPPSEHNSQWTESVLHGFAGTDGGHPYGGVIFDTHGALYGATSDGEAGGAGGLFKLTPPDNDQGEWNETTLYAFHGGSDGGSPVGAPVFDTSRGVLYGVTRQGGDMGHGAVYQVKKRSVSDDFRH